MQAIIPAEPDTWLLHPDRDRVPVLAWGIIIESGLLPLAVPIALFSVALDGETAVLHPSGIVTRQRDRRVFASIADWLAYGKEHK